MQKEINKERLFTASCIALIATATTFAIRANLIGALGAEFGISSEEMGIVNGTAFWGFTLSILIGGSLCDVIGMPKLLSFSFLGHIAGIILTIFSTGFWSLFASTLLIGISNGLVEAACNPLVATIYSNEKTKKINQFHMWFPGGIVIGGVAAYLLEKLGFNWQVQTGFILIPTIVYGFLFYGQKFPVTERVAAGVSYKDMLKECTKPFFIFLIACAVLSSCTELGTNQWIAELLGSSGVPSILLLVFISGLMTVGRYFAGDIEKRLSSMGILLFSAIFSCLGLYLFSQLSGYWLFAAAGVFAVGVCYFFPTLMAFISHTLPKTGAVGLSIMGGIGMLAVSVFLPYMGAFYDAQTALNIPEGFDINTLKTASAQSAEGILLAKAKLAGGAATLKHVAILPAILIVVYGLLNIFRKKLPLVKIQEPVKA